MARADLWKECDFLPLKSFCRLIVRGYIGNKYKLKMHTSLIILAVNTSF